MHHPRTSSRPNHPWTLCGLALVLAAVVTACDGKTPIGPTQTETRTSGSTSIQYPPPIPATGGATSIEGVYQLTVTASPRCSLPAEARQRTYTATIAEATPGHVTVSLSGAEFVLAWDPEEAWAGFQGTRNGDDLRFSIDNTIGPGSFFIERVDGTRNLFYEGVASATIADRTITGVFYGEIAYYVPGSGSGRSGCFAADHQMTFVR